MTIEIKPRVHPSGIESTFTIEHTLRGYDVYASHEWTGTECILDTLGFEHYDQLHDREEVYVVRTNVLIEREFTIRSSSFSEFDGHIGVYVRGVPNVDGRDERDDEIADPWLFDEDEEEFTIDDGYVIEQMINSGYSIDRQFMLAHYGRPINDYDGELLRVEAFPYAHHMGILRDSPSPKEQIEYVIDHEHPDAISKDEYLTSYTNADVPREQPAD